MKLAITILTLFIAAFYSFGEQGILQGIVPLPESKRKSIPVEKYRGKISGQVAAPSARVAGVWLEAPSLKAPANPSKVTLSQVHYQFTSSLIVVSKGTTVAFPNNDPDYHNIYSLSRPSRFDLGRYKESENPAPEVVFDKTGFIKLHCEIHDHMNASVIVVDSPYFTTTDAAGNFTLKGVPPGNYVLHAQLDQKTTWKVPIQVLSGKTSLIQFPSR